MKTNILSVLLISSFVIQIYADAVCTEAILVNELIQDIRDNGKLDCLRKPRDPPTNRAETEKEKKARIEAAWDSDCSFEADYDWMKPLKENFGLKTGLVDVNGKVVENDFEDQADMCEIVRALIAGGLIEGARLDEVSETIVDAIDCPGEGNDGQSEICAVSGGNAAQKYSWYILLEGISVTASGRAKWEMDPKSKELLEQKKLE